jgi:hypothetical protein
MLGSGPTSETQNAQPPIISVTISNKNKNEQQQASHRACSQKWRQEHCILL